MITDWQLIENTDEYSDDFKMLMSLFDNSFVLPELIEQPVYSKILAHILSIQRYLIRNSPDLLDIDNTPFLDQLAAEVGLDLPSIEELPLRQILKESRSWNSHKGSEPLYNFLAGIIGSPIFLYQPKEYMLVLDDSTRLLDGAESTTGWLGYANTKLAHIRDGFFYANYTYLVHVTQGHLVTKPLFLYEVLKDIHPAGTKMFLVVDDWRISNYTPNSNIVHNFIHTKTNGYAYTPYPGLDNGFILDDPDCLLDQLGGQSWSSILDIREARNESFQYGHRTIAHDVYMHQYPTDHPEEVFFKWKQVANDEYDRVYPDQDADLLLIQTENMSFDLLTMGDIENRSMRELINISMGNRGKIKNLPWFPDLPIGTTEVSIP